MKLRNFSMSYNLLAKSINQVIQHFLTTGGEGHWGASALMENPVKPKEFLLY